MSLSLVSDNTTINRLAFARVALDNDESKKIIRSHSLNELVKVTAGYQAQTSHEENIDNALRPTLKSKLTGPFILNISNRGSSILNTVITFEVKPTILKETKTESGQIILKSEFVDFAEKAIAVVPFLDVFKSKIDKEAKHATELLEASSKKETGNIDFSLSERQAENDLETLAVAAKNLIRPLFPPMLDDNGNEIPNLFGKEAINDSLAPSLSASKAFYDALWSSMNDVYEDSCRYLGQQAALGKLSLDGAPTPIRVN